MKKWKIGLLGAVAMSAVMLVPVFLAGATPSVNAADMSDDTVRAFSGGKPGLYRVPNRQPLRRQGPCALSTEKRRQAIH